MTRIGGSIRLTTIKFGPRMKTGMVKEDLRKSRAWKRGELRRKNDVLPRRELPRVEAIGFLKRARFRLSSKIRIRQRLSFSWCLMIFKEWNLAPKRSFDRGVTQLALSLTHQSRLSLKQ